MRKMKLYTTIILVAFMLSNANAGKLSLLGTGSGTESSCLDINNAGQLACVVKSGPNVTAATNIDGSLIEISSGVDDIVIGVSKNGILFGGVNTLRTYTNLGRAWFLDGSVTIDDNKIISYNEGNYIVERVQASGGGVSYYSTLYNDGIEFTDYVGTFRPFKLNYNNVVIGGQVIQFYRDELHSFTRNEIPEISGIGKPINDIMVSAMPKDRFGLLDMSGSDIWPDFYLTLTYTYGALDLGKSNVVSVTDDNFLTIHSYGGRFVSTFTCKINKTKCKNNDHLNATFIGLNNIGDMIGIDKNGNNVVALKNANGKYDMYDVNSLHSATSLIVSVTGINDNRQISATCDNNGVNEGCLLNISIPVPTTTQPTPNPTPNPTGEKIEISGFVEFAGNKWFKLSGYLFNIVPSSILKPTGIRNVQAGDYVQVKAISSTTPNTGFDVIKLQVGQ